MSAGANESGFNVQDVWHSNLETEFKRIRNVVQRYKYLALDTEFPGVVAHPTGKFRNKQDHQYQVMKCNVDVLNVIQIGISFFDEKGNPSKPISTWQFNFRFNEDEDKYAAASLELLKDSGLELDRHATEGIRHHDFAELLITSGVVLSDSVRWVAFHSCYDFGYMIKTLTNQQLPAAEDFFEIMELYFPNVYDIKYMMRDCQDLYGGLEAVAEQLQVPMVGSLHQAGVDSFVTGLAFSKMKARYFDDIIDDDRYNGRLYFPKNTFHNGDNTVHNGDNTVHNGDNTTHNAENTAHNGDNTVHNGDNAVHNGDNTGHNDDNTGHDDDGNTNNEKGNTAHNDGNTGPPLPQNAGTSHNYDNTGQGYEHRRSQNAGPRHDYGNTCQGYRPQLLPNAGPSHNFVYNGQVYRPHLVPNAGPSHRFVNIGHAFRPMLPNAWPRHNYGNTGQGYGHQMSQNAGANSGNPPMNVIFPSAVPMVFFPPVPRQRFP